MTKRIDSEWLKIIAGFVLLCLFGVLTSDPAIVNAFSDKVTDFFSSKSAAVFLQLCTFFYLCFFIFWSHLFIISDLKREGDFEGIRNLFFTDFLIFLIVVLPLIIQYL